MFVGKGFCQSDHSTETHLDDSSRIFETAGLLGRGARVFWSIRCLGTILPVLPGLRVPVGMLDGFPELCEIEKRLRCWADSRANNTSTCRYASTASFVLLMTAGSCLQHVGFGHQSRIFGGALSTTSFSDANASACLLERSDCGFADHRVVFAGHIGGGRTGGGNSGVERLSGFVELVLAHQDATDVHFAAS